MRSVQRSIETPLCEVFHFGDSQQSSNSLASLVLEGKKRATTSLLLEDESSDSLPKVGELAIVTNWYGEPLCIIETSSVEVKPFKDVDADFAAAEGEGDGSLSYWQAVHWKFFKSLCKTIGRSPEMLVICEQFHVVFSG